MKELSIEEKTKRYDEILAKAKRYYDEYKTRDNILYVEDMEDMFPELKESEDERIRKWIIGILSTYEHDRDLRNAAIDWLEKQGEQKQQGKSALEAAKEEKVDNQNCVKPADKVEPKFHEGEWIIHQGTENIYQVVAIIDNQYQLKYGDNYTTQYCEDVDRCTRLWDVAKDAKDGDVLASNHSIFIFSQEYMAGKPEAHCGIMNGLFLVKPEGCWTNEKCYPATKEQRDTLMKAMTDSGYTFDFEKKELKEIEQKSAECLQETNPNGGIVYEDFREGDGYYKVNLAYLSKSQVELIENLVASWQNPTNSTVKWSEEDERNLNDAILFIKTGTYSLDKEKLIDWLKSLKNRVQPQQEWNKVDKQMIDFAIRAVGLCKQYAINHQVNGYSNLPDVPKKYEELQDWLKSLRPQNRWKPSDEQMEALWSATEKYLESDNEYVRKLSGEVLESLYKDLKKLKD